MSSAELIALAPALVLAVTSVVVLAAIAWRRSHFVSAALSGAGLLGAMVLVPVAWGRGAAEVGTLLGTDGLFHLFTFVLAGAGLVCVVYAAGYFRDGESADGSGPEELYVLLLLGTLGSVVLAGSVHLASLFLGLELLSVSLYGLVAYTRERSALEAGLKYLILAAASSAFLLLGAAFLYAGTGAMTVAAIRSAASAAEAPVLVAGGLALLLVAVGFKLALVPFHLWTPDVYQGAAVPVTAFVASVSKAGVFALVLRWLAPEAGAPDGPLLVVLALVAGASMILGNLLALVQDDLKRLLAYSSIAHLGYLIVPVSMAGDFARPAGIYYVVAYLVTILAAFGVITAMAVEGDEPGAIEDYRGLFWQRPLLAAVLTASMLSLAGIPLTAGFVGKFLVVAAGADAARWGLVLILVLTSAVGLFYYLRVVVTMFGSPGGEGARLRRVPGLTGTALAALMLLLIFLGLHPAALLRLIGGSGAG